MSNKYDIVIIGSGAGGGTAAEYLSRFPDKNLKILILESGPYRTKDHFNQKEKDMTAIYFKRGAFFSKNLNIGVAAGNTVGGSTAVYTGVSFRPPASILEKWRNHFGLSFLTDDYVSKILDEIEQQVNVHELPLDWDNDNNRLFKEGADILGIPAKRLKINVNGCQQQGFCNLGCTSGGKQSTLEVQIPKAMQNGVELIYNAEVSHISKNSVHFKVKTAPANTVQNVEQEGEYNIEANVIVLAAGVLFTPTLLLKSLPHLGIQNENIGKYITLHPALNINGIYKENIRNYRGFPKTWYIDHFSDSEGYFLETSFYYPGITAKNNPGFGAEHQALMKDYQKMMSILILSHDMAEEHNKITLDKNQNPILHYTVHPEVKTSLIKALRKSAEILFAAGCEKVVLPGSSKNPLLKSDLENISTYVNENTLVFERSPLSSAHPQGGSRMGTSPENSVTDLSGKVWGTKNVYIADASLFPTSVKVNPYETVMLLSRYVSEQIINAHFV